jgi:hypothetical protein
MVSYHQSLSHSFRIQRYNYLKMKIRHLAVLFNLLNCNTFSLFLEINVTNNSPGFFRKILQFFERPGNDICF